MITTHENPSTWRGSGVTALMAFAFALVVALVLRLAFDTGSLTPRWDEPLMTPVLVDIVDGGWTTTHLLDYEDTKGPVFFWMYAGAAEVMGLSIDRLRMLSIAFFVLTALLYGLLSGRAGLGPAETVLAVVLLMLLPYHAVLGQLFMSEASFLCGALGLVLLFLGSLDAPPRRRVVWLVAYGGLLALLLHHRPHVVAYAGATLAAVTVARGRGAWPWWLAAGVAAASRIPLYLRWGGLVSETYQSRLGLGLRLDSLVYVAVALLPVTVVVLWPALRGVHRRPLWVATGAGLGVLLGAIFVPDLGMEVDGNKPRYMGMVATTLRPLSDGLTRAAFAGLGGFGGASLAAVVAVGWGRTVGSARDEVVRLAGAVLLIGCLAYGLTRGAVFDRYLLAFTPLLPFVWLARVPRVLVIVGGLGLALLNVRLVSSWLLP